MVKHRSNIVKEDIVKGNIVKENMRKVDALIGSRRWRDDPDNEGSIVATCSNRTVCERDAKRLQKYGFQTSTSQDDDKNSFLWVIVDRPVRYRR